MILPPGCGSVSGKVVILPPGCGSVSGKVVILNKALYGLKQSGRAWYQLLSPTLVECGFEQCLVVPCVFRLMVAGDVANMVLHVDNIGGSSVSIDEHTANTSANGARLEANS